MTERWSTDWDDQRIYRVVKENESETRSDVVSFASACRLLRIMRGEYEEKLLEMRQELLQEKLKVEYLVKDLNGRG